MRPIRNVEQVGGGNVMETYSLEDIKSLWNGWEIQSVVLVSLGLQILLFLAADARKHSVSRIRRSILWVAYMSADSVAVFALGHLAVGASEPRHQLLPFWAPFLLLHLGGQDTITAFAIRDNELWMRHLLGLSTQAAVASFVVSRSPWPDRRLLAAMLLMFLCGLFKYAERTWCLFSARPEGLRKSSLDSLRTYMNMAGNGRTIIISRGAKTPQEELKLRIERMLDASPGSRQQFPALAVRDSTTLVSSDALANDLNTVAGEDALPGLLRYLKSNNPGRLRAYPYVAALLSSCYDNLYTKGGLRGFYIQGLKDFREYHDTIQDKLWFLLFMLLFFFPFLSILAALVLFVFTDKSPRLYSGVDVIVSYILLIVAIVLEVATLVMSISSHSGSSGSSSVAKHFPWPWRRNKQWSQVLAQYNMMEIIEPDARRPSVSRWIRTLSEKLLGEKILSHIRITEDLMELVLDKLLEFGIDKKDWSFASFRGQLALQKRAMDSSVTPAMQESIHRVDFPTSVLTWHIATDICYFHLDNKLADDDDPRKEMARQLSNYIMYLIFECRVMLTTNSKLVHNTTMEGMKDALGNEVLPVSEAIKKVHKAIPGQHHPPDAANNNNNNSVASSSGQPPIQLRLLKNNIEALRSLVLPSACAVADELLQGIPADGRWDLISAVWLEMLYYIAPRCGGDFHSGHLSTGGEFVTHVLVLMHQLGPFLPPPGGLPS